MRITETNVSTHLLHQLNRLNGGQQKLQETLVTGQRVVRASDDPAAVHRVLGLQSEAARAAQFQKNIATATDIGRAIFSAADSLKGVSDRAGEIAIEAGGIPGGNAAAFVSELDQLIEHAVQAANAEFGGEYVLAGTATDEPPFAVERDAAGRIVSVEYRGNDERRELSIDSGGRVAPHASPEANREIESFLQSLVQLRDDIGQGVSPAESGIRDALHRGEDALIRLMGDVGATEMRLEAAGRGIASRLLALEENISAHIDADMVETIVRFNRMEGAYQAALQTSGRIMNQSLLDYI